MEIPVSIVKSWREQIGATHIVVFAVSPDGRQHVATHGETEPNAKEAADAGNKLKTALGWPEKSCNDKPLPRVCENCSYYKPDFGMWCMNGWSGNGKLGHCLAIPGQRYHTSSDNKCAMFAPKY